MDEQIVIDDRLSVLYAALIAAQGEAEAVAKGDTNTYGGYTYTKTEDMIKWAKTLLVKAGLGVIPESGRISCDDKGQYVLSRSYLIVHNGGGCVVAEQSWPICPIKSQPLDKACAGAYTSSLNYFLRDLLQIPRVDPKDDMDHDSRGGGQQKSSASKGSGRITSLEQMKSKFSELDAGGPGQFVDLMGGHGCESVEEVNALTGIAYQKFYNEARALYDELKGEK